MSERREFWITDNNTDYRVVEINQDEIVISREKLLQAFGQAYCSDKNAHKDLDSEVGIELARILFGEETAK